MHDGSLVTGFDYQKGSAARDRIAPKDYGGGAIVILRKLHYRVFRVWGLSR